MPTQPAPDTSSAPDDSPPATALPTDGAGPDATDVLLTGPRVDPSAWVAPGASVLGAVRIDRDASVWYACVLRADRDAIHIGARTNLQDATVVHADPGFPALIGSEVAVGHRALLHGCVVEDRVLIGMGAIVLNGARIGTGSIVGAGALVTQGQVIPPNSLVLGSPARVVRETTADERAGILTTVGTYADLTLRHRRLGGA
jgi:carbonic anhydrase/acetyltransferase-like protein (isoleucine patch superfamily)